MINTLQKEKLKNNWKDESGECLALVRVYDPLSFWQCYLIAMNNDDEILCIVSAGKKSRAIIVEWTLRELEMLYNAHGEGVQVDYEYRPRQVKEILKKLKEKEIYEWN